jgi:hypothetical protein
MHQTASKVGRERRAGATVVEAAKLRSAGASEWSVLFAAPAERSSAASGGSAWLAAAGGFLLLATVGCQVLLPSKLTNFAEDRRIIKQAEHDPFPSPADVGIETETEKK